MDAPIASSTKIHSFAEAPSSEREPQVKAELIADIEAKAQRLLTEQLGSQESFEVTSFADSRRMQADLAPTGMPLDSDQLETLALEAGADVVMTGRILVYGTVPAKYWLSTYAVSETSQLIAVGVLSGGNPIAIVAYLGYDLLTDLPAWTGGTYVFGLAYRPVFVEVKALQVGGGCRREIWSKRQIVLVAYRELLKYPWRERWKKEVQLGVNLRGAIHGIADSAAKTVRLQPCHPTLPPSVIALTH